MTVIINEVEVLAPPPAPERIREVPPENRPQPGPTARDVLRVLRTAALRRFRLETF